MSAEGVALIPLCAECGAVWLPAYEDRWEAFLTDDERPDVAILPGLREARVRRGLVRGRQTS